MNRFCHKSHSKKTILVDMVLKAVHSLSPQNIAKSFRVYDIAAEGEKVSENEVIERMK